MAKNTNTSTTNNTNNEGSVKRKDTVQAKDVVIAMMLDGIEAVQDLHNTKGFTKAVCNTAVKILEEKNKDTLADALRDFAADTFGGGGGARGKSAVKVGESREYSVQQVKDGDLFIRLPVGLLDVNKGAKVLVAFTDTGIVVRRAPRS